MTKTYLTEEQRAAIIADLRAKRPYKEMMAEYGLSWYVLSQTGLRAGVPLRGPGIRPPEILPEVGQVFGRLTVIGPREAGTGGKVPCRCECGAEVKIRARALTSGQTRSCGCLKLDVNVKAMHAARSAAATYVVKHPLYRRWCHMMTRCFNPKSRGFRHYGARGITVHESLRTPLAYIAYVESLPIEPGMALNDEVRTFQQLTEEQREFLYAKRSIDRINNDGNYEPGNLRWATWSQQNRNKRPRRRNAGALELLATWEKKGYPFTS